MHSVLWMMLWGRHWCSPAGQRRALWLIICGVPSALKREKHRVISSTSLPKNYVFNVIPIIQLCHWPPPAGCGSLCRSDPRRGRWPPHYHTVHQSSGPLRWPSDSRHLCVHRHALILKAELYRSLLYFHIFCIRKQNSFPSAIQPNSLSSPFLLHPLLPALSFLPRFLSYLPSLIPICCLIILPLPHTAQSPAPSFLSFTAHNPSHGGQIQITPRGRGFWVFRQRYYLTC